MLNFFIFLIILKIILTNHICKEGENLCSRCNPQKTLCIKCEKDIFIPNNEGGCSYIKNCKAGRNNCMECDQQTDLCQICDNEYYPDENGGCSYTDNCIISERGRCLKCKNNFILVGLDNYFSDGIKICKSLKSDDLKYCELIDMDNGLCLRCKDGYYLGNNDKKCTNIQNCEESVYGICKKCKNNFYLNIKENKCIEENEKIKNCQESYDGLKCDLCDIGYYFDDNYICTKINFCSEAYKKDKCKKCKDGYFLTGNFNSCTPEKNCLSGNNDFGICKLCNYDFYLDLKDRKCKSNHENNNFKYCQEAMMYAINVLMDMK